MKLSVALMCHASRRHLWQPLAGQLGDVTVCEDDGRLGRWGNGRRALLAYDKSATHHLVLQDDAVPAEDLRIGIEEWLTHLPDAILCLYAGKLAVWRQTVTKYATPPCWLRMSHVQWGVGLVMPTHTIADTVKIGDRLTTVKNYDWRYSLANHKTHRLPVYYPTPSWVEHAETPSTVPGRKPNRHALTCLSEYDSVLDWGTPGETPTITVPDFVRRALR